MLIYFHADPDETIGNVVIKNYPALTSIAGSPFSGAAVTDLLLGQYTVNVGAVTGNWKLFIFNSVGDEIAVYYASSTYVDGNGNATAVDYPQWLTPSAVGGGSGSMVPVGSHTIEFFTGEVADRTVTCIDGDGNAVTLTGRTLLLVIEDQYGDDGQSIPNAEIAVSGTDFTFAPSASITELEKTWLWSLRDTAANLVLMSGLMPIYYAAGAGSIVQQVWDGGTW